MTWTYDGDPAGDRKDEVRFLVGDTTEATALAQDEEIEYLLSQHVPKENKPAWLAAAATCDAIAGRFARQVQQSIGSLSRSAQQMFEHYRDLAAHYRLMYATDGQGASRSIIAVPVLGGGGPTYLGGKQGSYDSTRYV